MRPFALTLRHPRRQVQFRLAFASSLAAVAVLALIEGLVLVQLQWDWGYKQLSEPFRQVSVLEFAIGHPEPWGVSLVAAYPKDQGHDGHQRLIGLHPLGPSAAPLPPSWPVSGARTLAALPDRSQAILGCTDGALYLVDASPVWAAPRPFGRHARGAVDELACSPDGRLLLSLNHECLCGWDLQAERLLWQRSDELTCAAFHPDSRSLLCGLGDGILVQRDALTGEVIRELARFELPVDQLDVSPDGQRIAAVCSGARALVYDLPSGVTRWSRPWRWPVRFSPRGDLLASFAYVLGRGWLVVMLDADTGDEVASMAGHARMIHGVGFAADGSLYSWSDDRTIRQWDPVRHRQIRTLPAPSPRAAR